MNLSTSVTEDTDTRETADRPDRATVYRAFAAMIGRLPAPESIGFDDNHPEWVYLHLSCTADFDAWTASLCARVDGRERNCGHSIQSNATARWRGLIVSFNVCTILPAEAATEEPERTLTSVEREIEARAHTNGQEPYDATVEDNYAGVEMCGYWHRRGALRERCVHAVGHQLSDDLEDLLHIDAWGESSGAWFAADPAAVEETALAALGQVDAYVGPPKLHPLWRTEPGADPNAEVDQAVEWPEGV